MDIASPSVSQPNDCILSWMVGTTLNSRESCASVRVVVVVFNDFLAKMSPKKCQLILFSQSEDDWGSKFLTDRQSNFKLTSVGHNTPCLSIFLVEIIKCCIFQSAFGCCPLQKLVEICFFSA